jgi:hypothetical protein
LLQVLPTYVFTRDGKYELLQSERVSALSTRRASRDYNNHVHNDLVFWTWVVSGGETGNFAFDVSFDGIAHSAPSGDMKGTAKAKRASRRGRETIIATITDAPRVVLAATLATSVVSSAPEPDPDIAPSEAESEEFPEIEEELSRIIETATSEAESAG